MNNRHHTEESNEFDISIDISNMRTLWNHFLSVIRTSRLQKKKNYHTLLYSLEKEVCSHYEQSYYLTPETVFLDYHDWQLIHRIVKNTDLMDFRNEDKEVVNISTPFEEYFAKLFEMIHTTLLSANKHVTSSREAIIVIGQAQVLRTKAIAIYKDQKDYIILNPYEYAQDHPDFLSLHAQNNPKLLEDIRGFIELITEALLQGLSSDGYDLIIDLDINMIDILPTWLYILEENGYNIQITYISCLESVSYLLDTYKNLIINELYPEYQGSFISHTFEKDKETFLSTLSLLKEQSYFKNLIIITPFSENSEKKIDLTMLSSQEYENLFFSVPSVDQWKHIEYLYYLALDFVSQEEKILWEEIFQKYFPFITPTQRLH